MKDQSIDHNDSLVYFICGVSGCGKSTIGRAVSEKVGLSFYDGDDFHPEENVVKMKSGLPLNDDDRKGWLQAINQFISESKTGSVIACSALKEIYRIQLSVGIDKQIHWIFLDGKFDLIYNRMTSRTDHYMPPTLLRSQFDILEIPDYALIFDIENTVDEITENIILQTLNKHR